MKFKNIKKMEELNIPHLADSTLIGGSFQTPILEDITHGQRDNSRLFHTREDNSLPFHYYPKNVRKKKIMVSCSNDKFAKCKAKFAIISKNENNIIRCDQPGKQTFFKLNYDLALNLEDWEVQPNSGNFEHDAYFSYPLIFIMMRNKKKISYDDIFNFLKTQYFNKFEIELKPFMFHLDCEQATISSLLHNFPETPVTLCSVHIIRNLMKQLKTYTTGDFYKSVYSLSNWNFGQNSNAIFFDENNEQTQLPSDSD